MFPDTLIHRIDVPGVLPILPAAMGLLWVILSTLGGLLLAAMAMRREAGRKLLRGIWRQKWGLLVWILVISAAVKLAAWLQSPSPSAFAPPDWAAVNWPTFRGNLARSARADNLPGPSRGGVQWAGGRGFEFLSSPAVAAEHVVAVGNRGDHARLFAWDAATGRPLPLPAVNGWRATFSSVVIAEGLIVCGEGLHHTPNSRIVCFDLNSGPDWQTPLTFMTSSHVECTPVIAGGRIYLGAGDDGLYCLSVDRQERQLESMWHVQGAAFPDVETALAVHDGRVYAGLGAGGAAVCVLDAHTGSEIRRLPLPWPAFSPPAIVNGRLYVGSGQADYVHDESSPGEVCCFALDSLERVWSFATPAAVLSAVVADRGRILFSTVNGDLFVLDENGNEQGRWSAAARMLTAPAVTDDRIYCVATDGKLTALDRTSLEPVWELVLGSPGRYVSSPVVAHRHVYVGTPHDGLVCAGVPQ